MAILQPLKYDTTTNSTLKMNFSSSIFNVYAYFYPHYTRKAAVMFAFQSCRIISSWTITRILFHRRNLPKFQKCHFCCLVLGPLLVASWWQVLISESSIYSIVCITAVPSGSFDSLPQGTFHLDMAAINRSERAFVVPHWREAWQSFTFHTRIFAVKFPFDQHSRLSYDPSQFLLFLHPPYLNFKRGLFGGFTF